MTPFRRMLLDLIFGHEWRYVMASIEDLKAKVGRLQAATANVAGDIRALQTKVDALKAMVDAGSEASAALEELDGMLGAAVDNLEAVAAIVPDEETAPVDDGLEPEALPPETAEDAE